jgi:hypothetical protein
MTPRRDEQGAHPDPQALSGHDQLPYRIELWDLRRERVERVVARAAGAQLARAIFAAAQREHLGRLITLNRGSRELARSA